jgi:hypothetical protein
LGALRNLRALAGGYLRWRKRGADGAFRASILHVAATSPLLVDLGQFNAQRQKLR